MAGIGDVRDASAYRRDAASEQFTPSAEATAHSARARALPVRPPRITTETTDDADDPDTKASSQSKPEDLPDGPETLARRQARAMTMDRGDYDDANSTTQNEGLEPMAGMVRHRLLSANDNATKNEHYDVNYVKREVGGTVGHKSHDERDATIHARRDADTNREEEGRDNITQQRAIQGDADQRARSRIKANEQRYSHDRQAGIKRRTLIRRAEGFPSPDDSSYRYGQRGTPFSLDAAPRGNKATWLSHESAGGEYPEAIPSYPERGSRHYRVRRFYGGEGDRFPRYVASRAEEDASFPEEPVFGGGRGQQLADERRYSDYRFLKEDASDGKNHHFREGGRYPNHFPEEGGFFYSPREEYLLKGGLYPNTVRTYEGGGGLYPEGRGVYNSAGFSNEERGGFFREGALDDEHRRYDGEVPPRGQWPYHIAAGRYSDERSRQIREGGFYPEQFRSPDRKHGRLMEESRPYHRGTYRYLFGLDSQGSGLYRRTGSRHLDDHGGHSGELGHDSRESPHAMVSVRNQTTPEADVAVEEKVDEKYKKNLDEDLATMEGGNVLLASELVSEEEETPADADTMDRLALEDEEQASS